MIQMLASMDPQWQTILRLTIKECERQLTFMCTKRELLECTDIGATTYVRYRVQLKRNQPMDPLTCYSLVANGLSNLFLCNGYTGCYRMAFRVQEDTGYVMQAPLMTVVEICQSSSAIFKNAPTKGRKLLGKFHLEVLIVNEEIIDDEELLKKYEANLDDRLQDASNTAPLKEKVNQTEKWFEQLKMTEEIQNKQKIPVQLHSLPNETNPFSKLVFRWPSEGKFEHVFAEKWCIDTVDMHEFTIDRPPIHASIVSDIFKKSCLDNLTRNTFIMLEFCTEDARRAATKLRPYKEITEKVITSVFRDMEKNNKQLTRSFNFMVYAVDIPEFADFSRAPACLDFIRKALQAYSERFDYYIIHKKMPEKPFVISYQYPEKSKRLFALAECTVPLEQNCNCEKLHVSDYCDVKLILHKKVHNLRVHNWSVKASNLAFGLYSTKNIVDLCYFKQNDVNLYSMIVTRICQDNFSADFGVGTNIICEVKVEDKMYSSGMRHHSDIEPNQLKQGMFANFEKDNVPELLVTVYVVDILKFASNEIALRTVNNLRNKIENAKMDCFGDSK